MRRKPLSTDSLKYLHVGVLKKRTPTLNREIRPRLALRASAPLGGPLRGDLSSEKDPVSVPAALEELRQYRQFVAWRYVERDGRRTKLPVHPGTGEAASSTDPDTWASCDEARVAARQFGASGGIGFVVTVDDPFVGIDIDHCLDADGRLTPEAQLIVTRLDSYTEVTPSGKGLRVYVKGKLPPTGRRRGNVEMYEAARFFTVTGWHLAGTPEEIRERPVELLALHAELFPPRRQTEMYRSAPLSLSDGELLDRMFAAANGPRVTALWRGEVTAHGEDDSAADLALVSHLRFWTGGDRPRVEALFRQSGLMREKWDARRGDRTYGERTLDAAFASGGELYSGSMPKAPTVQVEPPTTEVDPELPSEPGEPARVRITRWSALELLSVSFPEPTWAVPGIVSQGLTLLCGPPKIKKSFMSLQICLAVAAGGRAFGSIPVERGDVLYAALEDTERRLQDRMRTQLAGDPPPEGFDVWFALSRVGQGGLEELREWLTAHERARLVIIDTFQRVRSRRGKSGDVYDDDYEAVVPLKSVADEFNVAIVAVHHTRKMTAEDRQDMVSGSNGLAGAADTTLILAKTPEGPALYGRGRDVEEMEHALAFDPAHCLWSIEGDAEERRRHAQEREVLAAMETQPRGITPGQIARLLKLKTLTVLELLLGMERQGRVFNGGSGLYVVREA